MFSQLFFILLALILVNFTTGDALPFWIQDLDEAIIWSFCCYCILLLLLYLQAKFLHIMKPLQTKWKIAANIEILLFLSLYHFGLGGDRFLAPSIQTISTLLSLFLFFFALGWSHLWHGRFSQDLSFNKSFKNAYQYLIFYMPLTFPFLVMSISIDGLQQLLPTWNSSILPISQDVFFLIASFFVIGLTLLFFPPLMMHWWRCKELTRYDLKERLNTLCATMQFRHGGLKIWSVMPHSFTAGIIGIAHPFRYILFTPRLLSHFQAEEVEAILVHEIGHSHHRHLLLYPLILLGMGVSSSLLLIGLEEAWTHLIPLKISGAPHFMLIMALFIAYAAAMGLYFRFIFGFFSRLFERQADLHIFASPLPPETLVQALDRLGIVTGYTHNHPSWHHFSLQERIYFLYQAMDNPSLVAEHHRRVKQWLFVYAGALALCFTFLYWYLYSF